MAAFASFTCRVISFKRTLLFALLLSIGIVNLNAFTCISSANSFSFILSNFMVSLRAYNQYAQ
jgi:hypothetical protein